MRRPYTSLVLASLAGLSLAESGGSEENALAIGFVDNSNFQYVDGCGCTFCPAGEKLISSQHRLILAASGDKAWINVGGEVVELEKTFDGIRFQGEIGDEFEQRYESADTSVSVTCKANGYGDTHAVFCDARIEVTRGAGVQILEAEGSCGC